MHLKLPYHDPARGRRASRQRHGARHLVLLKVQTDDGCVVMEKNLALLPSVQRTLVSLLEDSSRRWL